MAKIIERTAKDIGLVETQYFTFGNHPDELVLESGEKQAGKGACRIKWDTQSTGKKHTRLADPLQNVRRSRAFNTPLLRQSRGFFEPNPHNASF